MPSLGGSSSSASMLAAALAAVGAVGAGYRMWQCFTSLTKRITDLECRVDTVATDTTRVADLECRVGKIATEVSASRESTRLGFSALEARLDEQRQQLSQIVTKLTEMQAQYNRRSLIVTPTSLTPGIGSCSTPPQTPVANYNPRLHGCAPVRASLEFSYMGVDGEQLCERLEDHQQLQGGD